MGGIDLENRTDSSVKESLLSVRNVYKSFGLNAVLKGISLDLASGEALSLIGGNGAGKSTLMKIIMGIYSHDRGEIFVNGHEMTVGKPSEALAQGVYMVPQEPLLFPNMTVEENILIGFDRPRNELHRELVEKMGHLGWQIGLERKASSLSIAEQQMVEILRGLLRHAQVLILDEPTSALTFREVESLFRCVEDLKSQGIGIIYITHRLNEVFQISTTVAIMRDGVITLSGPVSDFTKDDLVRGLLPSEAAQCKVSAQNTVDYSKPPVFELRNFSGYGFTDVSLKVYPGEILGLAGVVGAGRSEMALTIFGRDKVLGGSVILDGRDITGLRTQEVIRAGLNYVPEDRHADALFKISDVAWNTTSALLNSSRLGRFFLNRREERTITQQYVDDFRIKVTGQDQLTGSLSGGNQQKIVIGRSLSTAPKLVILDEPTRGIDAAARGDVYCIIRQLRDQGVSILLISSDMEEIMELSDRAMSIYLGRVNCEFSRDEINENNLTSAAFGLGRKEETV